MDRATDRGGDTVRDGDRVRMGSGMEVRMETELGLGIE